MVLPLLALSSHIRARSYRLCCTGLHGVHFTPHARAHMHVHTWHAHMACTHGMHTCTNGMHTCTHGMHTCTCACAGLSRGRSPPCACACVHVHVHVHVQVSPEGGAHHVHVHVCTCMCMCMCRSLPREEPTSTLGHQHGTCAIGLHGACTPHLSVLAAHATELPSLGGLWGGRGPTAAQVAKALMRQQQPRIE